MNTMPETDNLTKSVRIFTGNYGGFRFPLDGFRDRFYELENQLVISEDQHDAVTDESDRRIWWTDDSTFIAEVISCQVRGTTEDWPDGYAKFITDCCHDNPPAPEEMRTFDYLGQTVYAVGCAILPTPAITDTMHSRE